MSRSGEERTYTRLTGQGIAHGSDPFDLHIVASIIAIAAQEARTEGISLSEGLGLESWELRALFLDMFPGAMPMLDGMSLRSGPVTDDESALRDIFRYQSVGTGTLARALVKMMARRCQRPNHLWQDLGFGSRRELSAMIGRYYPRLAARNAQDMKWKKFLYRMICSSSGFSLCMAPVCSECDDFDDCFGPEDGESILARMRAAPQRQEIGA